MCQGVALDLGVRMMWRLSTQEVIDGHTSYPEQPAQLTPGLFGKHIAEHHSPAHRPMSMQAISPGQLARRQSAEDSREIDHDRRQRGHRPRLPDRRGYTARAAAAV
jgi:hypothetical protein